MTEAGPTDPPDPATGRAPAALLLAALALLALFPPETRGESMGACALATAIAALLIWPRHRRPGTLAWVVVLGLAIPPLWRFAFSPGVALPPLIVLYLGLAAGVVAATVPRTSRRGPAVAAAIAAAGTVVAAHGVYQALWGLERAAARLADAGAFSDRDAVLARLETGRAFAGFATPAALGGYLAIAIPVTVGLAVWVGRKGVRAALIAAAVIQLAGLLATSSFTAAGALLGAVALVAVTRPGLRRVLLPALGVIALLAIATVWIRGSEIADLEHGNHPLVLRAGNMRIAAEMAADHPLRGVGAGGYGEAYPSYRADADNASRHAHNVPLEWIAEFGVPVGTALGVLFLVSFGGAPWRRSRPDGSWIRGVEIGLLAFALQNLADFTALMPSVLWTAAILRGAIANPPRDAPAGRPVVGAVAAGVVLTAAVVAAMHGASWNDRHVARARIAEGDRAGGEILATRAAGLAPWDADARQLVLSARLVSAADAASGTWLLAEALPEADRLVGDVPLRPSARALRAAVREAVGDRAGAYSDLAYAADLYPRSERYRRERDRLLAAIATDAGDSP